MSSLFKVYTERKFGILIQHTYSITQIKDNLNTFLQIFLIFVIYFLFYVEHVEFSFCERIKDGRGLRKQANEARQKLPSKGKLLYITMFFERLPLIRSK